jgi:hypothetical protein
VRIRSDTLAIFSFLYSYLSRASAVRHQMSMINLASSWQKMDYTAASNPTVFDARPVRARRVTRLACPRHSPVVDLEPGP